MMEAPYTEDCYCRSHSAAVSMQFGLDPPFASAHVLYPRVEEGWRETALCHSLSITPPPSHRTVSYHFLKQVFYKSTTTRHAPPRPLQAEGRGKPSNPGAETGSTGHEVALLMHRSSALFCLGLPRFPHEPFSHGALTSCNIVIARTTSEMCMPGPGPGPAIACSVATHEKLKWTRWSLDPARRLARVPSHMVSKSTATSLGVGGKIAFSPAGRRNHTPNAGPPERPVLKRRPRICRSANKITNPPYVPPRPPSSFPPPRSHRRSPISRMPGIALTLRAGPEA